MTAPTVRFSLCSFSFLVFCLMISFTPGLLMGQTVTVSIPSAERYTASRASGTIKVDGILDEPAWASAVTVPLNYEWLPGDNIQPPVRTEALISFDEAYFYIGFRAWDDEPEAIRAHLMDRDDVRAFVQDDHVGFMIDTFNDERRAFQFRINPLGVQVDGIFSELDGIEDFSWDIIWSSEGRITEEGYVVEVALPFNQLRFPSSDEPQTWGVVAFRSWPRSVRHRIRSHAFDRGHSCILCQINKVDGFQQLSAGRNIEFVPTTTARRTDRRAGENFDSFEDGSVDPEFGFSGRWGITSNMILNATINPDFSQVEADVAQLEGNERFALFFEEKRPFFLEGLDFFQTPLQAVFTRTIIDPRGGFKVTGKAGRHAIGAFAAQDRGNRLVLPSNQQSGTAFIDDDVTSGVLRYRRDVGSGSAVGVLYTGREGSNYRNHLGGVDAFLRLSNANTLTLQALRSSTVYPDSFQTVYGQPAGTLQGAGITTSFAHTSRNWQVLAAYEDVSPEFRADGGFVPRVDTREGILNVNRRFWSNGSSWFTQLNTGITVSRTYDYDGKKTDQLISLDGLYRGPLQSLLLVQANFAQTRFAGRIFDLNRLGLQASIQPNRALALGLTGRVGEGVDFFGARKGTNWLLGPTVRLKMGRRVSTTFDYIVQRFNVAAGRLFTEQLVQTQILYHFNVRLFIRATAHLRLVDRNEALYSAGVNEEERILFSQFLFSYKFNPQTVVFLGYSDNYRGVNDRTLLQLDRTFFLKLGYAWIL